MKNDLEVLVVGGGHTGISVAYSLAKNDIEIGLVEAGRVGGVCDDMLNGTLGPSQPSHSRMITTSFESCYRTFSEIHGEKGAKTFLELSNAGCEMQKSIARKLNPNIVRELGSLVVGYGRQISLIKEELGFYKKIGFGHDYEWWSKDMITNLYGSDEKAFHCGLFIPQDAIIDPIRYVVSLKNEIKSKIAIVENTKVVYVKEREDGVVIKTDKEEKVTADNVVFATNGFYIDENLKGIIDLYWSFIVCYKDEGPNTPNTWDFSDPYHYWTRQDNFLMVGGEDRRVKKGNTRFSPDECCAKIRLENWVKKKFPMIGVKPVVFHYGVFARTPDEIPIVGKFSEKSRRCYVVGCNGMGQAILTYAASLIPMLLGYEEMDKEQRKFAEFLSPTRKTLSQP